MDGRRARRDGGGPGGAGGFRSRAASIGGGDRCGHPAVEALGVGGPLRFGRCSACGAVVVTTLDG